MMKTSTKIWLIHYKRMFVYWIKFPYTFFRNYFLVKKYPFLKPSCGWGVNMEWRGDDYKYHYEETWLDTIPKGWRKAFGKAICDDLKREINNSNLTDYKVCQTKEKWGLLCWYDEGGDLYTQGIIDKYEKLSETICQNCGKKAEYITTNWIGYFCKDCINKMNPSVKYKPIKEVEDARLHPTDAEVKVPEIPEEEEHYGYLFKLTCMMCPEQYDVYKDGKYVAYVRKRYGHLNAHYVKDDGEVDWDEPFYSVNEGDSYSGTIENRKVHFKAITDLLTEHLI